MIEGPTSATAHGALARALMTLIGARLLRSRETGWASSGFSGRRHRFLLDLADRPAPRALDLLERTEFDLPGHIVADITLVSRAEDARGCRVTIEALTVEDL